MIMTCMTAFAVPSLSSLPTRAAHETRCRARPLTGTPCLGAAAPRLWVPTGAARGGRWRAAADGNGEAPATADKAATAEVCGCWHGWAGGGCLPWVLVRTSLFALQRCVLVCSWRVFFSLPLAASFVCLLYVYDDCWLHCVVPMRVLLLLHAHSPRRFLSLPCESSLLFSVCPLTWLSANASASHELPPSASVLSVASVARACLSLPVAGLCSLPLLSAPPRVVSSAPTGT